ncbi:MAG TPA: acetyltransferase [Polyangiaceae bacterium]|nr:acetyltransferase [Polyangiaceae bacterium]
MSEPGRIIVYGAGGHGRVVLDALVSAGLGDQVLGFVDDGLGVGERRDGFSVLGGEAFLSDARGLRVALGIGDNHARARLAQLCIEQGLEPMTALHPRAIIASSVRIGAGSLVCAGAVLNPGAVVGQGSIVNSAAVIEHDCKLGSFVHVSPNATLGGAVELGDYVHLGLAACVLPGLSVGEGAVVGAGAVVTRSIPSRAVAYGVPARVQRTRT